MKIKLCVLILAAFQMVWLPIASHGDQTDERLNALFDALGRTDDLNQITNLENQIWEIWYEHPDEEVEALLLTGTNYMNLQFVSDAMVIFNQIIKLYPDYAEAWNRRATLNYMLGNLDASISDIEKTLALEPRHFGALSGLGLVYIQQGNLLKAREAFESMLSVHPNSPAGLQNLDMVKKTFQRNFI